MTCEDDGLAERIFDRFMRRSGFQGGWLWGSVEKGPAAVRAAGMKTVMNADVTNNRSDLDSRPYRSE